MDIILRDRVNFVTIQIVPNDNDWKSKWEDDDSKFFFAKHFSKLRCGYVQV